MTSNSDQPVPVAAAFPVEPVNRAACPRPQVANGGHLHCRCHQTVRGWCPPLNHRLPRRHGVAVTKIRKPSPSTPPRHSSGTSAQLPPAYAPDTAPATSARAPYACTEQPVVTPAIVVCQRRAPYSRVCRRWVPRSRWTPMSGAPSEVATDLPTGSLERATAAVVSLPRHSHLLDTRSGRGDAGSTRIGLKSCRRHVDLPQEHLWEREKRAKEEEDDPATAILALCRTSGVELR
jgi:hypothetical protein